jgi:hypothetical protein
MGIGNNHAMWVAQVDWREAPNLAPRDDNKIYFLGKREKNGCVLQFVDV